MGTILEVKNLTKKFGGLTAVNDVSFEIRRGEFLGLIGPNGAGKTTLFNLIFGSEKPSSGTVRFDGRDITGMKPYKIVNLGIADSASFPIFPKDLTASRRILQSSSSRYSIILSTEFSPDFSPISPNTNIELNLIERISLSIFFITSPITDESFSILDKLNQFLH
ncbi:unnamed protein product, partial [marine sediment metagenome]